MLKSCLRFIFLFQHLVWSDRPTWRSKNNVDVAFPKTSIYTDLRYGDLCDIVTHANLYGTKCWAIRNTNGQRKICCGTGCSLSPLAISDCSLVLVDCSLTPSPLKKELAKLHCSWTQLQFLDCSRTPRTLYILNLSSMILLHIRCLLFHLNYLWQNPHFTKQFKIIKAHDFP